MTTPTEESRVLASLNAQTKLLQEIVQATKTVANIALVIMLLMLGSVALTFMALGRL